MKGILIYLTSVLSILGRLMRELAARLIDSPSFAPVLSIVGNVRAQVFQVPSIFAKAPCSATGGTA